MKVKTDTYLKMEEIVSEIVRKILSNKQTGKNILKSVFKTALVNIFTLPFGIVSTSITRSKSEAEFKTEVMSTLYPGVEPSFFDGAESKIEKESLLKDIDSFYQPLSTDEKINIVIAAIRDSNDFKKVIKANLDKLWLSKLRDRVG